MFVRSSLVAFSALVALATRASSAPLSLVYGVDSSSLVPTSTYAKARSEGFTKAVIRGYQEACSVGGQVDPNFLPSYNNARAAGITDIDTYWFPCTGDTILFGSWWNSCLNNDINSPKGSGNKCKSYDTQLAELGQTFVKNRMNIGTIWLDIETSSECGAVRDTCLSFRISILSANLK
jgi:hypothetical protein